MSNTTPMISLRFDLSALTMPIVLSHRAPVPELGASPDLRDDVRQMAIRGWEDRTRMEYIGTMIVRRFHGLLVDVNAPMDLQELALAMQLQEQQHAIYCWEAAKTLGSAGDIGFEVRELQQQRDDQPLDLQLIDMILATYCIGEVVALRLLQHSIRALPDSPYRDILRRILKDEVLHGRFGPELLRQIRHGVAPRWIKPPGEAWLRRRAAGHIDAMRRRDVVEPDEAALFEGDPEAAEQLESCGIPPSAGFKAVYMDALDSDVPRALAAAGL